MADPEYFFSGICVCVGEGQGNAPLPSTTHMAGPQAPHQLNPALWRTALCLPTWLYILFLIYVATKATYIRLLHGKIGFLRGFFGPSSVKRGWTHIVLR